jgi:hypothetical protein
MKYKIIKKKIKIKNLIKTILFQKIIIINLFKKL